MMEFVWIPAFFKKKKVVAASLGGDVTLVDAEDLVNNISISNWLCPSATGSACIVSIAYFPRMGHFHTENIYYSKDMSTQLDV
jgi:hypothetical protein